MLSSNHLIHFCRMYDSGFRDIINSAEYPIYCQNAEIV